MTLTSNLISRESENLPTVAIYLTDIKRIVTLRTGSIMIRGNDPKAVIGIPREIDDYESLKASLEQIMPIMAKRNEILGRVNQLVLVCAVVALMCGVYGVQNKIVATVCGALLVGVLIWGFIAIRRSRNVDVRAKRRAWLMLLLVASVVFAVLKKWTS